MSGLIDPTTGRPFGPTTEQIANVVTQHQEKLQALTHQVIHIGIFLEYCMQQVEEAGTDLKLEGFQDFATAKYKELEAGQKEQIEQQKAGSAQPEDEVTESEVPEDVVIADNTPVEITLDE